MLYKSLRPLLGVMVSIGTISLVATPVFSQITPEPLQPTIERIQPTSEVIQPVAPQNIPSISSVSNPFKPTQSTVQFIFTNGLQYSNCLEDILQLYLVGPQFRTEGRKSSCRADIFQAYKGKQMPKQQALELIQMADFYATSLLTSKLHPPKGQRQRVRQMFGFIYAIDANDQTVLRTTR